MLILKDIKYTIWEYKANGVWSIVEAVQGTGDEAKSRADELKTLHPESEFGVRTAWPVDGERLKQAFYYGHVLDKK